MSAGGLRFESDLKFEGISKLGVQSRESGAHGASGCNGIVRLCCGFRLLLAALIGEAKLDFARSCRHGRRIDECPLMQVARVTPSSKAIVDVDLRQVAGRRGTTFFSMLEDRRDPRDKVTKLPMTGMTKIMSATGQVVDIVETPKFTGWLRTLDRALWRCLNCDYRQFGNACRLSLVLASSGVVGAWSCLPSVSFSIASIPRMWPMATTRSLLFSSMYSRWRYCLASMLISGRRRRIAAMAKYMSPKGQVDWQSVLAKLCSLLCTTPRMIRMCRITFVAACVESRPRNSRTSSFEALLKMTSRSTFLVNPVVTAVPVSLSTRVVSVCKPVAA